MPVLDIICVCGMNSPKPLTPIAISRIACPQALNSDLSFKVTLHDLRVWQSSREAAAPRRSAAAPAAMSASWDPDGVSGCSSLTRAPNQCFADRESSRRTSTCFEVGLHLPTNTDPQKVQKDYSSSTRGLYGGPVLVQGG